MTTLTTAKRAHSCCEAIDTDDELLIFIAGRVYDVELLSVVTYNGQEVCTGVMSCRVRAPCVVCRAYC